jgi:hypothetical protein
MVINIIYTRTIIKMFVVASGTFRSILHLASDIICQSAHHTTLCRCKSEFLPGSAITRSHLFHLALTLLVFAHYSDKLKVRSPFIFAGLTMCLISISINISTAPSGVKYFGTFCIVMGSYAALPGLVSWYIIQGHTREALAWPSMLTSETSVVPLPSVIYRSQDSSRFNLGCKFNFAHMTCTA